ncbi:uncharacterized protein LOC131006598 [Salvia miltiorrhiza]|uniref:uncharacterized protein LOC131006598 n=1 Tax=Salvia miltiorrhiza TaxID=226208 RepID=UPI0025ACCF65|nr:uncharacterized protein LOC131006598 [Salvia miltiorrhiza]XP_057789741.1 uncharacterized protein LOC131006598 [Salvia miltiorrhiza]
MASTSYQWPSKRIQLKKLAAASNSDPIAAMVTQQAAMATQQTAMATQLAELTTKLGELNVGRLEQAVIDPSGMVDVNYVNDRNYENFQRGQPGMYSRGQQYQQGQQQFQPGARPHPNLSYGNPNNALQPPPGFSVSSGGVINEPKKGLLEDMMQQVLTEVSSMKTTVNTRMTNLESQVGHIGNNFSALSKQVHILETQVGQMANQAAAQHKSGQFPSNTTVNSKGQCNSIFDGTLSPKDRRMSKENDQPSEEPYKAPIPLREYIPKVPFPRRLMKREVLEEQCAVQPSKKVDVKEIKLEVSHCKNEKKIANPEETEHRRIVDELERLLEESDRRAQPQTLSQLQDPKEKEEKVVVHTKKMGDEDEKIPQAKAVCTELPMKLLSKKKDPGSFTIECEIGGELFPEALCDLGASVNVMPISVFKRLGIGDLKPTSMEIQMADRSRVKPRGKLEDIFVKVDKLVFPTDFLVLDIPEDANPLLILGRSFLATGRAMIDVPNGSVVFHAADAHESSVSVRVRQSVTPSAFDVH